MPKRSNIWLHFEITKNKDLCSCNYCGKEISVKNSSIGNLGRHLRKKHPTVTVSAPEDPTECLKEFITVRTTNAEGDDRHNTIDVDEDSVRGDDNDAEWEPPKKTSRKSKTATPKRVVKKEIIHSNGVEYEVYTRDPSPVSSSAAMRANKRPIIGQSLAVSELPILGGASSQPREENSLTAFARFLSLRLESLKSQKWQSYAINEINSALHRVEMLCYESKVESASSQTDAIEVVNTSVAETSISPQVVQLEVYEEQTIS